MMTPDWVSLIAPFAAGAAGVGATYGVMKQSLTNLKERIMRLEVITDHQVGDIRCDRLRGDCQNELRCDIREVKVELRDQRKILDDVNRFMGKYANGPSK